MGLSTLRKKMTALFEQAVQERIFPGAVAGVALGGGEQRHTLVLAHGGLDYGEAPESMDLDVAFDLASLTKPFVTVLAILCLQKAGKLNLQSPLSDLLGVAVGEDKAAIQLQHLLGHCSGLPAHQPYFSDLASLPEGQRQDALLKMILNEPLAYKMAEKAVYSDLGYILLGWIIENLSGHSLQDFMEQAVLTPLGLTNQIFFNPQNIPRPSRYAPTEECTWRRQLLIGQVDDDNCFAMGGVAGHAGIFGTMHGALGMACHLLDVVKGRVCHPNYYPQDLIQLLSRQHLPEETTWALGFDTPSGQGSSGGRHLSAQSFGHLGFTGTSFWLDPEKDLAMVLLTNRVHPSRENIKIRALRPLFHDLVVEELGMC